LATQNKKFVIKNGLAVGGASGIIDIVDSNGTWIGATGILHGATGPAGSNGATGPAGANGASGPSGATGVIQNWIVKTTTYTAVSKDAIAADTSGGAFTITLPATPVSGDSITIADSGHSFNTNNLTIARNGSTIETQSQDLVVDIANVIVSFIYNGTTWKVFSTVGIQGASGASGAAGTNGATGIQGASGVDGASGFVGSNGATGVSGATGSAGSNGTNGATGVSGATGSAGSNGTNGATGPTGATGIGISGATGTIQNWVVKTTTYTAVNKDAIAADTSGGAFTITLPASPSTGDSVTFADSGHSFNTNNLTIARNGSTIESSATDLVADVSNIFLSLIYDGTTWKAFSTVGVQGASGATGSAGTNGTNGATGLAGATGPSLASANGDIMPAISGVSNIGSANNKFNALYTKSLYLDANTLYVEGVPVLSSSANNISFSADPNQGLRFTTTGTGNIVVSSNAGTTIQTTGQNGDVIVQSSGQGALTRLTSATQVTLTAPTVAVVGNQTVSANLTVSGNFTVAGNVTSVDSTITNIKDNIITLNKGEVGSGVTLNVSGIEVDRGDLANQRLIWSESSGKWLAGPTSSEIALATETFVNTGLSGKANTDLSNVGALANNVIAQLKGDTGATGVQGASGVAGTNGATGSAGTNGASGIDGATGAGVQGASGVVGATGIQGASGITGASGAAGSNGINGATGVGIDGATGAGVQGASGATGPAGVSGASGVAGASGTGGGGGGASITDDTTTNASYYPAMYSVTTGTPSDVYTSSSKIYFNPSTGTLNSTIYNSLSDEDKKKNIKTIGNAIDTVNQLNGVEFDWKDTGVKSYGVIAQEIEKVLPDLVTMDDQGNKSVNYNGLFGFLINAIKEQQKQIDDLKGKI
jgi:hypothetical protein